MTPYTLAESASFITVGAFSQVSKADHLYHTWARGGIELHALFIEAAQIESKIYDALCEDNDFCCPGCWLYDVSEKIGEMIAYRILNAGDYTLEALRQEIVDIICQYVESEDKVKQITLFRKMTILVTPPAIEPPSIESRVKALEERYEGFLVGLNENIDSRVRTSMRTAFGKAHDEL